MPSSRVPPGTARRPPGEAVSPEPRSAAGRRHRGHRVDPGAPFGDGRVTTPPGGKGEGGVVTLGQRLTSRQRFAQRSCASCCAGWDRTALLGTGPRRPHSVVGRGGSG